MVKHRNQIDYILCSQRWRSSIQSAKTRPGADCGSDHELLIDKFRLKLKKLGKTTRPFRYDLNHIPYDYTVEVRNRFKGLDLIDRVPDELGTEVCDTVQETGIKTIPRKKMQKAKWLSEEVLQIAVKRREAKSKGEKERYFSSCPQSLPPSESFPMSQLFARGGQNTGVSALASFFPKKSQG